jgi:lipopolysaccharide export system permease protein
MAAYPGVGNGFLVRATPRRPRLLPIMDAYILRELWPPFAFALGAYLLFWFVNIFFLAADYVINKGAPIFLVLRFLIFRVPQATPQAFPFACLFATLMAFGRLMADNEITALRTSGVPFYRIVRLPLIAGMLAFGASYWINENVVPASTDLSTRTFYQIVYKMQTLPLDPNIFRQDPATGNTFYVGNVEPDGKTMHNVMIFEPSRTSPFQMVTTAVTAQIHGGSLTLYDASISRYKPSGDFDFETHQRTLEVGLPLAETADKFLSSAYSDPYTMDSKRLREDVNARKATGQGGSDLAKREITLAQKLAYPFASFIAVLIALPLAVRFGKKGRTLGIALSIVVLFVYYVLGAMSAAFGSNNALDPYVAAWLPNVIMAGAGAFLILSEDR